MRSEGWVWGPPLALGKGKQALKLGQQVPSLESWLPFWLPDFSPECILPHLWVSPSSCSLLSVQGAKVKAFLFFLMPLDIVEPLVLGVACGLRMSPLSFAQKPCSSRSFVCFWQPYPKEVQVNTQSHGCSSLIFHKAKVHWTKRGDCQFVSYLVPYFILTQSVYLLTWWKHARGRGEMFTTFSYILERCH